MDGNYVTVDLEAAANHVVVLCGVWSSVTEPEVPEERARAYGPRSLVPL
jgi:hypothetical protein